MKQEMNTELIERYLRAELYGEELSKFERRLLEDEKLREEVEIQRLFVRGIENAGMRKTMDAIHQSLYPAQISFLQSGWINLLAGGSFGVLIIAAFILSLNNQETPLRELPYQKPKSADTSVSRDSLQTSSFADGPGFHAAGNYPAPLLPAQMKNYLSRFPDYEMPANLHTISSGSDTIITGIKGTRILIPRNCFQYADGGNFPLHYSLELKEAYDHRDLIMNDLTGELEHESRETNGAVYINATEQNKALVFAPEKKIQVQFKDEKDPKTGKALDHEKQNVVYYKLFDDRPEIRLIALPNDVLDYEINYVRKVNDGSNYTVTYAGRSMNEKIESLLEEKYWNTYISTIQFHYRIEGCMLYSENTELLDIYLKNTALKLWEVDSMVAAYLKEKALNDCANYSRYMKAEEYFRWLKSRKCGSVTRIERLNDRNYHKGQFYNNIPNNKEIARLQKWGLTREEAFNMLEHFKKIYVYKSKLFDAKERGIPLDDYYADEGRYVSYEMTDCGHAGKNSMELSSFLSVNKLGWVNYEKYNNKGEGSPLRINVIAGDSSLPVKVYLVFKEQGFVMGGSWTKSGYNYFPDIPDGSDIVVIALSYGNDRIWFGRKQITAGKLNEQEILLEDTPPERVKTILSELD